MFLLINRIAWILSITLWILISSTFFGIGYFLPALIPGILVGLLIKWLLLSESFIQERVEFFARQVRDDENFDTDQVAQFSNKNNEEDENSEFAVKKIVNEFQEKDNEEEILQQTPTQEKYHTDIQQQESLAHETPLQEPISYEPSRAEQAIKNFFKENLLAKIWGILVFLWVLFLLSLVWDTLSPLFKLILGFAIGFSVYFAGIFLHKKQIPEAKILLGTGILINFLVILWWKHILSLPSSWIDTLAGESSPFLSSTITFILLIANTVFAVVTSLHFKSRTLLIFSFLFAYLNPFLLWESSQTPYILVAYSLFVSLWAIFLGYKYNYLYLKYGAFILWSVLFILAPFSSEWAGIVPTLALIVLSIASFFCIKKNELTLLVSASYFFFLLLVLTFITRIENISHFSILFFVFVNFVLFVYALFLSKTRQEHLLFPIATFGSIFVLSALLKQDIHIATSILILLFFGILHTLFPFWYKKLDLHKEALIHTNVSLVAGSLFLVFHVFVLSMNHFLESKVAELNTGVILLLISLYYFAISFLAKKEFKSSLFAPFGIIGISFFTLAVALIFSKNPQLIGIIWLFEANILFFMYNRTNSIWLKWIGIILLILWIIRFSFIDFEGVYFDFVSLAIILISLLANIQWIHPFKKSDSSKSAVLFDIMSALWIFGVLTTSSKVVSSIVDFKSTIITVDWVQSYISESGIEYVVGIGILCIVGFFFLFYSSRILKVIFILLLACTWFLQINDFKEIALFGNSYYIAAQYFATILFWVIIYLWNRYNSEKTYNYTLNILLWIYLLIIVSFYIFYLFDKNSVLITIFWWVIWSLFLTVGISKDTKILRTIGLYYIAFVVAKVFLYDIWYAIDNPVSRVIVFIVLWIVLIAVSIKYSKTYGDDLVSEFNLSRFFWRNSSPKITQISAEKSENTSLTDEILATQIYNLSEAQFYSDNKLLFKTKAKNLLKITLYVLEKEEKKIFEPWELQKYYDSIAEDFESELSAQNLITIKKHFKIFVEKGGEIRFR